MRGNTFISLDASRNKTMMNSYQSLELPKTKVMPHSILDFEKAYGLATHLLRYIRLSQIKKLENDFVSSYLRGYFLKYHLYLSPPRSDEFLTFAKYLISKLWHKIAYERPDLDSKFDCEDFY